MEEDNSSLIGDSFDSNRSSSATSSDEEEEFTLGNDSEACDFLQAMNVEQEKSETTTVAPVTGNNEVSNVFEFYDEEFETDDFFSFDNNKTTTPTPVLSKNRCCDRFCNSEGLTLQVKEKIDKTVKNIKTGEVKAALLNQLYSQQDLGMSTTGFCFAGKFLCHKAFCAVSEVSIYMVREVFQAFSVGQRKFVHGNVVGMKETAATIGFMCWFKQFASNYGNYAPDEKGSHHNKQTVKFGTLGQLADPLTPTLKLGSDFTFFTSNGTRIGKVM